MNEEEIEDILKNPSLYAAQLAQLQAAQLLLARQQQEQLLGAADNGDANGRKRSADDDIFHAKHKLARGRGSPDPDSEVRTEKPLDLSGNKSPDLKPGAGNYFNSLMPAGLLSFFNQLRPPAPLAPEYSPRKTPPHSPPAAVRSPWQAQWNSKHGDAGGPEDVFKCVWCKESYQTLEALTVHMKEAKHHSLPAYSPHLGSMGAPSPLHSLPSPTKPNRDILREQMPLPRKLVRGQDVWIGRADEQTRDILKCMSCGQSFRSLDLLTKHMTETQHYKKVMSHDQISSWKYPESQPSVKNHVNSVLTCKVCDKGFGTLKDLSDHMVRANHYADHKVGRGGHAPAPSAASAAANRERKKALPVKKLLELERARQEVAGTFSPVSSREALESGKLLCERCEERIPIDIFIPHIQQCVGRPRFLKNAGSEPTSPTAGNKEGNCSSKSDGKEKGSDGTNSILGSLELLVKGNFQGSSSRQVSSAPSPGSRFRPPQFSPDNKFSISNLFPSRTSPGLSSPSGSVSKPASPIPLRGTILGQKLVGSEMSIKEEDRQSPVSEKSRSSPASKSDDGKSFLPVKVPSPLSSPELGEAEGRAGGGGNPLAQLQMFCEDQKKSPKGAVREPCGSPMSDPGAILAFSWACNQAVSNDSVIKCPFCDTPFISKGAYRHHLSKMHFTKENLSSLAPGSGPAPGTAPRTTPSPETKDAEESLQSKYHKYSQLAKQLSCCEGTN